MSIPRSASAGYLSIPIPVSSAGDFGSSDAILFNKEGRKRVHHNLSEPSSPISPSPSPIPLPVSHSKSKAPKSSRAKVKIDRKSSDLEVGDQRDGGRFSSFPCCLFPRGRLAMVSLLVLLFLFYTAFVGILFNNLCQLEPAVPLQKEIPSNPQDHGIVVKTQESIIEVLRKDLSFMTEENSRLQKALATLNSATKPGSSQKVFQSTQRIQELPSTSVFCQGNNASERICHFRNLCYFPEKERYIVAVGNSSTFYNLPFEEKRLLDLTSLDGHSAFYFSFDEVTPSFFKGMKASFIPGKTIGFSRFHPGNIMHVLHDDFLGLYFLLKQFGNPSQEARDFGFPSDLKPFDLGHNILVMDGHSLGQYGSLLFPFFTSNPVLLKSELPKDSLTCFEDIVIGQSKRANWYQYGFGKPQGPIPNKTVSGTEIREFSNYVLGQLGFHPRTSNEQEVIVLFARFSNRKIVNQDELAKGLEAHFQLPVKILSMEENDFKEQVSVLSRAAIAIGLHGSMLIMAMFLPPGAALIELYPFAVPSDNYTPYRTLGNFKGMNLAYRAWENKHEENTITFPERDRLHGGVAHLSADEQKKIIQTKTVPTHFCCEDPYWLFRIYQDTIAHVDEIVALADEALQEAKKKVESGDNVREPKTSKVEKGHCVSSTPHSITISWGPPWNGARVKTYSIWVHEVYTEYTSERTEFTLQGLSPSSSYQFWVRAAHQIPNLESSPPGEYSEVITCSTTSA